MNAIVAANSDWGIGRFGAQALVISEDRLRFRALTDGGVVIAGRKTFEHLPGLEPLPNRKKIVLTRNPAYMAGNVTIAHSINEVFMEIAGYDTEKTFVIGGGEIYRLFLPFCTYAYVTRICIESPSDVFFPDLDALTGWSLERREFGIWNPESEVDENPECESPLRFISRNDKDCRIHYTFNVYKNNAVEEIYV